MPQLLLKVNLKMPIVLCRKPKGQLSDIFRPSQRDFEDCVYDFRNYESHQSVEDYNADNRKQSLDLFFSPPDNPLARSR